MLKLPRRLCKAFKSPMSMPLRNYATSTAPMEQQEDDAFLHQTLLNNKRRLPVMKAHQVDEMLSKLQTNPCLAFRVFERARCQPGFHHSLFSVMMMVHILAHQGFFRYVKFILQLVLIKQDKAQSDGGEAHEGDGMTKESEVPNYGFMDEISDALEKQLKNSTITKTFIHAEYASTTGDKNKSQTDTGGENDDSMPVDVDFNLVESLLDSFSSTRHARAYFKLIWINAFAVV